MFIDQGGDAREVDSNQRDSGTQETCPVAR